MSQRRTLGSVARGNLYPLALVKMRKAAKAPLSRNLAMWQRCQSEEFGNVNYSLILWGFHHKAATLPGYPDGSLVRVIDYGVGVIDEQTYRVKPFDHEYFGVIG